MSQEYAVWNPHNKLVEELPVIYGFNNGGSRGWMHACLMAQDGTALGSHICSDEYFMPYDLGIIEGTRSDRHERDFQAHYPDGYRMEFVTGEEVRAHSHKGLMEAYRLNQESAPLASSAEGSDKP